MAAGIGLHTGHQMPALSARTVGHPLSAARTRLIMRSWLALMVSLHLPFAAGKCAAAPPAVLQELCAALDHCSSHGRCIDSLTIGRPQELPCSSNVSAVCVCHPSWSGLKCDLPACPHGCHGRGTCAVSGDGAKRACVCDKGYFGEDCGTADCPLKCSGHGTCDAKTLRCRCDAGFGGDGCERRLCPLDCSGAANGLCLDGVCHCHGGRQGVGCELHACPSDCSGRGTCAADGKCACFDGWGGDDCATLACPADCSGHGRCLGYGSPARVCKCDEGWGGENCAQRTCPAPGCGAHGACIDGACACASGYAGAACDVSLCPRDCSHRGRCVGYACECEVGWAGADCSERACSGGCAERQFCHDGACLCLPGFTGRNCTLRTCPHDCGPHGTCRNGVCACESGFSGTRCEQKACPVGGLDSPEPCLPKARPPRGRRSRCELRAGARRDQGRRLARLNLILADRPCARCGVLGAWRVRGRLLSLRARLHFIRLLPPCLRERLQRTRPLRGRRSLLVLPWLVWC